MGALDMLNDVMNSNLAQNANQITFSSLFGKKKKLENRDTLPKLGIFSILTVFWQKRGQILSELNSVARFGILSSF